MRRVFKGLQKSEKKHSQGPTKTRPARGGQVLAIAPIGGRGVRVVMSQINLQLALKSTVVVRQTSPVAHSSWGTSGVPPALRSTLHGMAAVGAAAAMAVEGPCTYRAYYLQSMWVPLTTRRAGSRSRAGSALHTAHGLMTGRR